MQLRRLTALAAPACPWVKPALTDLYAISLTELPATVGPPRLAITPPPGTEPPPWQYGWQDLVLATTVVSGMLVLRRLDRLDLVAALKTKE